RPRARAGRRGPPRPGSPGAARPGRCCRRWAGPGRPAGPAGWSCPSRRRRRWPRSRPRPRPGPRRRGCGSPPPVLPRTWPGPAPRWPGWLCWRSKLHVRWETPMPMAGFRGAWQARIRGWLLAACLLVPGLACAEGTVLVLGDSLSAAHNIPAGQGWVSLLEQRLRRELRDPPAVVNASISGETSAGALARLPDLLRKHRPTVVVIALGGNDALRGLPPAQLRGNLERMATLSRQAGARVLLLGI